MPDTNSTEANKAINDIVVIMEQHFANTNTKIDTVQSTIDEKISSIKNDIASQQERISTLESYSAADKHQINSLSIQLEILKQDRLRNNIRLTGLPPLAFDNPTQTTMNIIDALKIQLLPSDFVAYSDRNKSSIILQFNSHSHKRYLMDALRKKSELLVEEILNVQSNSKVYANDQLTPYFSNLFQKAWHAKKNKQIYSVSSLGGRIKAKKNETSSFIIINSEEQLNDVIEGAESMESVEMSQNAINESPDPIHADRKKNTSTHRTPILQAESETIRSSSSIRADRNSKQQTTKKVTKNNNNKDPNRNHQWQQMRQKQNHRYEHHTNGRRNQHQDQHREIEISPRHYRSHNPRLYDPSLQLPLSRSDNYRHREHRHYSDY